MDVAVCVCVSWFGGGGGVDPISCGMETATLGLEKNAEVLGCTKSREENNFQVYVTMIDIFLLD